MGPGVLGFLRQPPSGKTGVQKYIGCRTRPHGGGSGEGGGQAGGWAPLGSAHCWSGAGFQQRRHLCCAHRLSRPKGTPVAAPNGSASATEAQKSAHFTLPASHSPLAARPHSKFTKLVYDALMTSLRPPHRQSTDHLQCLVQGTVPPHFAQNVQAHEGHMRHL